MTQEQISKDLKDIHDWILSDCVPREKTDIYCWYDKEINRYVFLVTSHYDNEYTFPIDFLRHNRFPYYDVRLKVRHIDTLQII